MALVTIKGSQLGSQKRESKIKEKPVFSNLNSFQGFCQ